MINNGLLINQLTCWNLLFVSEGIISDPLLSILLNIEYLHPYD